MRLSRALKHWLALNLLVRVLAIVSIFVSLFGSGTISHVFAACSIDGTVYRDYNANGTQDAQEPGVPNITVTAYSDTGSVGSAKTGATGTYTLAVGAAVPEVRVEFSGLPEYLRSGPFGAESDTTVTFVACAGTVSGVDLGTANPGQYCDTNNPDLATPCFAPGDPINDPFVAGQPALVSFPYLAGSTPPNAPASYDAPPDTVEATIGQVARCSGWPTSARPMTTFSPPF